MKKIFGFTFNVCLSMVVLALLLSSCIHKKQELGKVITKEIKVTPFQDLRIFGNASVTIIPGDTYKVVLKGKENLIANAKVKVEDGVLNLSFTSDNLFGRNEISFRKFTREDFITEIYVTMPALRNIYQEGNSEISIDKAMQGDSVYCAILGNADLNVAGLKAKSLQIKIEGNADADLEHLNVERTKVDIFGNASMDLMFDLGNDVNLSIQGNGSATLKGVTRNKPVCNLDGNGSVEDNTTRPQQ